MNFNKLRTDIKTAILECEGDRDDIVSDVFCVLEEELFPNITGQPNKEQTVEAIQKIQDHLNIIDEAIENVGCYDGDLEKLAYTQTGLLRLALACLKRDQKNAAE